MKLDSIPARLAYLAARAQKTGNLSRRPALKLVAIAQAAELYVVAIRAWDATATVQAEYDERRLLAIDRHARLLYALDSLLVGAPGPGGRI